MFSELFGWPKKHFNKTKEEMEAEDAAERAKILEANYTAWPQTIILVQSPDKITVTLHTNGDIEAHPSIDEAIEAIESPVHFRVGGTALMAVWFILQKLKEKKRYEAMKEHPFYDIVDHEVTM